MVAAHGTPRGALLTELLGLLLFLLVGSLYCFETRGQRTRLNMHGGGF
jgi:hypothetical protein